jgi:AcrR family transcriptional regulator
MKETDDSSKARLIRSGRHLFARLGYEQASTVAIARDAGTSETQLVRCFGGKGGLLEAIFNEGWVALNARVRNALAGAASGRAALIAVLSTVLAALARDRDLATLFLLEGRRIRGGSFQVTLSAGYIAFQDTLVRTIRRAQKEVGIDPDLSAAALASALVGAAEGLIRDRLIARRWGRPPRFSDRDVVRVIGAMLDGFRPPRDRARGVRV